VGLFVIPEGVYADHNAGGELTWECKSNGKFVFTLKLYRYCEGINLGSSATVSSNSPVTSFSLTRSVKRDISPKCYDSTQWMTCYGTNSGFTIDENVYVSGDVTISGTPPATGWSFYWSSCCRPAPAIYNWGALVDNLEPQNQSYRIKATMFPYNGKNTNPCYDNSPQFAELPATIICTGYPFTYNHNAVDKDLDSLTYVWGTPLLSSGASVSYATNTNTSQTTPRASGGGFIVPSPGFSSTVPLPWSHSNMNINNVPASINLYTGEISFTSFTKGQYATAVIVSSYRCGIKIAEIMRDIPVTLLSCPPTPTIPPLSNSPPQVVFKWGPNLPTSIPLPAGDSVWAGDSVSFYITSTDIQFLPGFIGQTNYLIPGGSQFGNKYSDTLNGCLYPPCATIDTNSVFYNDSANWWEGQFGIAAKFSWKTNCNHLNYVDSCFTRSNKYNFVFKVLDNWCPAPGSNFQTFTVTVLASPAIDPPKLKCSWVMQNGDVLLSWDQPVTRQEDTLSSFRKYIIYRSDSGVSGPFDTLHVVLNIDSLQYLDSSANAINIPKFYYIQGVSSCNDQAARIWSDTIAALSLASQTYNSGGSVALNWNNFNPGNNFGNKTTGQYYVWRIYNNDTILLDSTVNIWDSLDLSLCFPSSVEFFVTVEDTSKYWGCSSISNTVIDTVGDVTAPNPILLDSVSFDINNSIQLGWQASANDIFKYYISRNNVVVDSVLGNIKQYTYVPSATDSCVLSFSVAAMDTCGNLSASGIAQFSMCAEIVDVIRCDTNKQLIFRWDLYNPFWSGGLATQEIYRSVNVGPFLLFDTVSAFTNQYSDTSILGNTTYRYRIRSWESGKTRASWTSTISYTVGKIITGTIVPAPDLRCISWENDTTIRLDWKRPANPDSNFNKYLIYHSENNGTFQLLDSIRGVFTSDNLAWDSTFYTHVNVNPNAGHRYFVYSSSGCDGFQLSPQSRTLSAIDLQLTALSDSVNRLDWNKISSSQLGNPYNIYRNGTLYKTLQFGTETDQDKLIVCYDSVAYQVTFMDAGAYCTSRSKEVFGYYEDDTPPAKQFLDSVSMLQDSSFTGMVGWSANPSKDIINYYVLKCLPGNYQILDTLNSTDRWYLDLTGAPLNGITEYSVTAVDSCGNSNLSNMNFDCHNTIVLSSKLNKCDQSLSLLWNAYDDFASGDLIEYHIFSSENGSPFTMIAKTNTTSNTITGLNQGSYYCFYIQAWENEGAGPFSSSSALSCLTYEVIKSPEFAYLRYVTVADSGAVRMCMKIDLSSDLGEYWIKRSADPNAAYSIISTVTVPDPKTQADSNFCFEDKPIGTDNRSYYYYIDVADPCGNVTATTNPGRTIFLSVEAEKENNRNVLTWNMYNEWNGNVKEYLIYRRTDKGQMKLIETLKTTSMGSLDEVTINGDEITYSDDVSREFSSGNGEFCYRITAREGSNTFMDIEPEVSSSNIVCATQLPLIYAPNSFTPNGDGLNDKFLPTLGFHDLKSFKMQIYNRWGERIYETEDAINGGWDGNFEGNEAPQGAYVYIVAFSSSDGQEYEEQGTVTLSR